MLTHITISPTPCSCMYTSSIHEFLALISKVKWPFGQTQTHPHDAHMLPASNYPHGVPLSPGEQIKLHRRYEHWASIEINWHYLRSWIIHAKLCRSEILVLLSQPKNRFCMIRWHSARLKYLWLSYSPRISHTQRIGWPDVRMYVACCYICVSTKPEIILDWMEYRTSPFASSHTHTPFAIISHFG